MKVRDRVQLENPSIDHTDLLLKLAAMWALLSPSEKLSYCDGISPAVSLEPLSNNSVLVDAVNCASRHIIEMDQPTDPTGYLTWLGAHVVNKYVEAHSSLPEELEDKFADLTFLQAHTSPEIAELSQTVRTIVGTA
jgi:hypothetical protein